MLAQTGRWSFRPPFSKGGTDPTPWGVGRPPQRAKLLFRRFSFCKLFLLRLYGQKKKWLRSLRCLTKAQFDNSVCCLPTPNLSPCFRVFLIKYLDFFLVLRYNYYEWNILLLYKERFLLWQRTTMQKWWSKSPPWTWILLNGTPTL